MKKYTVAMFALVAMMALSGCGGSTKTYQTVDNNITVDEPYEIPGGTTLILDGSDNATVTQENQTITIDCGGSCGDITIGLPIEQ